MSKKVKKVCCTAQNGRDAAQSVNTGGMKRRNCKSKDAPSYRIKASNLREACELAKRGIFTNDEDLGKSIVHSHILCHQHASIIRLYKTFKNTIEA